MAQSSPGLFVTMHGAPNNCKLKEIKDIVVELLGDKKSVSKVTKCKNLEGSIIPGKLELELHSIQDVQKLLEHAVVDYERDDTLYSLKVTRSRPKTSALLASNESTVAIHSAESGKVLKSLPRKYKEKVAEIDFSDDDTSSSSSQEFENSPRKRPISGFGKFKGKTLEKQVSDDESSITSLDEDEMQGTPESEKKSMREKLSRSREDYKDQKSPSSGVCKLPKNPVDWLNLLQNDPSLFREYRDQCVLVRNTGDNLPPEQLSEYFEAVTKGRVLKITLLVDGILVVFHNAKHAKIAIEKRDEIESDGYGIEIFPKPVPLVYDDRVLVKGNFKGKSKDEIMDVLYCCTDAKFKIKKLPNIDMFLVAFEESIDVDDVKRTMAKLPLRDLKPQTIKVCRSDCIKVGNVRKEASEDKVKLAFMNRKLNSSGEITLVQCNPSSTSALVYFANYKDAEKIVKKAKQQEIKVARQSVEVSLYCPGINGSVDISSYSVSQFRFELDIDRDIIEFVTKSAKLKRDLFKELGDLAEVEFTDDSGSSARFTAKLMPLLSEEKSQEMEQDNFENECKSRIRKFCSKFKSKTRKFQDEDRDRVRKELHWDKNENEIVEVKTKTGDRLQVFVRWEEEDEGAVKATGFSKDTSTFLDWFEEKCNFVYCEDSFSQKDFQVLLDCGIITETSSYFEETVKITVDIELGKVIFEGSKDHVAPVQKSLKSHLQKTNDCDTSFLHPLQNIFLEIALSSKSSNSHIDIADFLRDKLKEDGIRICLFCEENKLKLVYGSQKRAELDKAKEKIVHLIKYQPINLSTNMEELLQEEEWKELKKTIESSGTLLVFKSKKTTNLQLVGLPLSFEEEHKRIQSYFEDNAEVEKRVNLSYQQTSFICSFPGEVQAEKFLNKIEWFEEPGGIHLKGRASLLRKGELWLREKAKSILTSKETLSIPGGSDFLRSKGGKQFLKTTSRETLCVIQLDTLESSEWNAVAEEIDETFDFAHAEVEQEYFKVPEMESHAPSEKGWFATGRKLITGIFSTADSPPSPKQDASVQVSVKQGDILSSDCEVIINTTGNDFDLTASQLSAKLIRKSGKEMEHECNTKPLHAKKDIYRVTSAPNCQFKNVIHLVTPKSADKISVYLSDALQVVETKLKLGSLAIPAIGTGQIGLSSQEVAKSIRRAIDFFKKTDPVNLKKIEVVIFNTSMVSDFAEVLTSSSKPFAKASVQKKTVGGSSLSSRKSSTLTMNRSQSVTVKTGDILASACEVMVNTTGSDYGLTASQLSKLVLKNGGNGIATEIQSNPIHQSNSCRVTTGGNMNFKYIVHFVTPNNPQALANGLEEVLTLVDGKMQSSSLAIPAVGTGNANLNVSQVAQAFDKAINNFFNKQPQYLKVIEVVIFDQNMLKIFQKHIKVKSKAVPSSASKSSPVDKDAGSPSSSKVKKSRSTYFPQSTVSDDRHAVQLFFTSNDRSNMAKAWKAICDKAEEKCAKKCVDDEVLEYLDQDDWDEIIALEREFNICIRPPDDDSQSSKFFILGEKNKVLEAFAYALTLLQRFHKAVACREFINWKYEDETTKSMENFSLLTNSEIENAYKEDDDAHPQLRTKMNGSQKTITIDLKKMTMLVEGAKSECKIKRVTLSGVDKFPTIWDNTKHVQLVNLVANTQEYTDILNKFNASRGNVVFNVVKIERVENRRLYSQFIAQRNEVEERMKATNPSLPVTLQLFHGTHSNICEQIYKGGFNRSYAGRNATVYGNGVYFATTSQYSHRYTNPNNQQGERKMFLADVVTGEYAQGQQGYIAPPPKAGGSSSDLYDSVVDNINGPSMYVVFKDACVYPLYILSYR